MWCIGISNPKIYLLTQKIIYSKFAILGSLGHCLTLFRGLDLRVAK